MDHRKIALSEWVVTQLKERNLCSEGYNDNLVAVSGDASFRRYFRTQLVSSGQSFIAVDAPSDKEDSCPFVAISKIWRANGIQTPEVIAVDFQQGFMLLSDLGDNLYLHQLNEHADALYQRALTTLIRIQKCPIPSNYPFPTYKEDDLRQEMLLCPDWFFTKILDLEFNVNDMQCFHKLSDRLVRSAQEQPQVCVHRDYHSRNLMVLSNTTADNGIGILDFQDAVVGPVSYDLVSLLRDCYISWPEEKEIKWIGDYLQLATQNGIWLQTEAPSYNCFKRWFDWMGLQRHIKCLGIFSRLYLRDNKADYLQDIPRTFTYIKKICAQYPEFSQFNAYLDKVVIDKMLTSPYFAGHFTP